MLLRSDGGTPPRDAGGGLPNERLPDRLDSDFTPFGDDNMVGVDRVISGALALVSRAAR